MRDGYDMSSLRTMGDYWPVHLMTMHVTFHSSSIFFLTYAKQTSRIWDAQSGETKAELRGHEMSVESITFVPVPSYKALGELVDLGVSCIYSKVLVAA